MLSISTTSLSRLFLLAPVSPHTPAIHNQMDLHTCVIAVQKERAPSVEMSFVKGNDDVFGVSYIVPLVLKYVLHLTQNTNFPIL